MYFRTASALVFVSFCQTPALALHETTPVAAGGLPEVESVMTRATGKAMDFAQQAQEMQRRVASRQAESKAELARSKENYEQSLRAQAALNKEAADMNAALNASIATQRQQNAGLLKETERLQKGNAALRQSLVTIKDKVEAAKEFLIESMKATDDAEAPELKVLTPTTPTPTLDQFLRVAASEEEEDTPVGEADPDAPSLLQVTSRLRRRHGNEPADLVQVLSHSLEEIATAEKEGEAQLKASYMANLDASQKRHEELLKVQAGLNSTLAALQKEGASLMEAKKHLTSTQHDLDQRVKGLRKFAAKVDAFSAEALRVPTQAAASAQTEILKAKKGASKAKRSTSLLEESAEEAKAPVQTQHAAVTSEGLPTSLARTFVQSGVAASAQNRVNTAAAPAASTGLATATAEHKVNVPAAVSVSDALEHAQQAVHQASVAEAHAFEASHSAAHDEKVVDTVQKLVGKAASVAPKGTKVAAKSAKVAAKTAKTARMAAKDSKVVAKAAKEATKVAAKVAARDAKAPAAAKQAHDTTAARAAKAEAASSKSEGAPSSSSSSGSWRSWFGSWR